MTVEVAQSRRSKRVTTDVVATVQRSSASIGTIAAALARAQAQLVNPEKSLVGTIRSDGRRGAEQTFRYAPLSSGLTSVEVRKCFTLEKREPSPQGPPT
jgi:hypothetical protein